jgi:hypothetical protein|tara:strand:+ start:143 stop:547 length:405 start_codon:yes stop_codon:yes gene_type:complete
MKLSNLINELEDFIVGYSMYGLDTPISLSYLRNGCTPYAYGLAIHLMGLQFNNVHTMHIANVHCVTLVDKYCVDIVTGVIFSDHPRNVISNSLKPLHKLSNFAQRDYNLYWLSDSYTDKKLSFEIFKISPVGKY